MDGLVCSIARNKTVVSAVVGASLGALAYKCLCAPQKSSKGNLTASAEQIDRMLDVIEKEILPITTEEVTKGNKVFGAAVLRDDFSTIHADTNHETISPLYHGEIYTIKQWSETLPKEEQVASDAIFLSTHEPCCMCISAIVWSGFKKCYYFFPYETTRDQGIPHDINIMNKLWAVDSYQKKNDFLDTACIFDLIDAVKDEATRKKLQARAKAISKIYDDLSSKYHTEKKDNPDNILAFN